MQLAQNYIGNATNLTILELYACYIAGAYPEIFRERGFESFLYGRENLGGLLGFFLKKP